MRVLKNLPVYSSIDILLRAIQTLSAASDYEQGEIKWIEKILEMLNPRRFI